MKRPLSGLTSFLIFPECPPRLLRNPQLLASFKSMSEGVSNVIRKLCFAIKTGGYAVVCYVFSDAGGGSRLLSGSSSLIYRSHLCGSGLFNLFGSLPLSHWFLAFEHSIHSIDSRGRYKISSTIFQPCARGKFQDPMIPMIRLQKYNMQEVEVQ